MERVYSISLQYNLMKIELRALFYNAFKELVILTGTFLSYPSYRTKTKYTYT
jgi:hypothetical protein